MLPAVAASVRFGGSILWCTLVMALAWSCSNSDKARDTAGITPVYLRGQAFSAEIRQQTAMWGPVLKNSGIQAKD